MASDPDPVVPDYGGACLTEVVPALLHRHDREGQRPPWLPEVAATAEQVVLLVLDGVGWEQLQARSHLAPTLSAMAGGPITTVAPSTTATALTSLTTGAPPARHGVVGYRMRVAGDEVLNTLRWTTLAGDARHRIRPETIQPLETFGGTKPAVVTKSEFGDSGFSAVHLAGTDLYGWRFPSTLVVRVRELVAAGRPFVYAYYPGVDTVAHEFGFGPLFDAELTAADRLVSDLLDGLPPRAALVVVADHGQVDVGERVIPLDPAVVGLTTLLSGEGRFRWLHARPGLVGRLLEVTRELYGDVAWVLSADELVAAGWLGGQPDPEVMARLGDVALVAREDLAFLDSADTGSYDLQCRHGSMTRAEMLVPLLAASGRFGEG